MEVLAQSVSTIAPTTTPAMTIPLVFALAGNGTWLVYLLATAGIGLVALLIATFARHSASPGSLYSYATTSLPTPLASLAAWALLLAYVATGSSVAGGFINYANVLLQTFSGDQSPATLLVATAVIVAAWMAYRDIKVSAQAMLWMEGVSVACIALVMVLILFRHGLHVDREQLSLSGAHPAGIRLGLVLAMFSFVGFESATTLGAEAREPLRTIPRAVMQCAVGAGIFFMVAAYTEVLGFRPTGTTIDKSPAPMHVLSQQAGVSLLGLVIDVGAMISMFACTLACITAAARLVLLMSHHGLVHGSLRRTHARNETPHIAVIISAIAVLIPALVLAARGVSSADIYGWMGSLATYGFITVYGLVCIGLPIRLKRQQSLTQGTLWIAIAGAIAMLLAFVGNLYPMPQAPYSWLPYIYLAYLLVTLVANQLMGSPRRFVNEQ
ncbi:APC family permease [Alloacidobacterium dinghuense]|uniref:APC family permease n=2 Tax=Alloacidobacterium dinghuense TaxID=2763107 RepID=A0A7G8BR45_9BACT|nr:APC family permease [Alloacidobacterium dinghuense]